MSQALTLARPYARAAFAVARDEGSIEAWSQALAFSAQVAADPRVAGLLLNPALSHEDAVRLVAPEGAGGSFLRFLGLLAEAGRLRLEHKQASLEELGQYSDPPLTKDAVAGRIRRLLAMADKRAQELGVPDTESVLTQDMLDL